MRKLFCFSVAMLSAMIMFADSFVKVTTTPTTWDGEYLIVCENANVAFNGSLAKLDAVGDNFAVSIDGSKIYATSKNLKQTFILSDEGSIQSKSGNYIGWNDANKNGINETSTAQKVSMSIDADGNFVVKSESGSVLRYNASTGQERFRFFKPTSYTNQTAIQLYRLEKNDDEVIEVKATAIDVESIKLYYYEEYSEEGSWNYSLEVKDKTTGWFFFFDLYTATKDELVGTYTFSDETLGQEYTYSQYGEEDDEYYDSTYGKVVISKDGDRYNVQAEISLENGNDYALDWTGTLEVINAAYEYESEEVTNIEMAATEAGYIDYTTDYKQLYVYLDNSDKEIVLAFNLDATDAETIIPVGEYKIDNTTNVGTVSASTGSGFFGTAPSVLYTDYTYDEEDGEYYANTVYYLMTGTVKVEKISGGVRISVDAKSYNGSTIKAVYEGGLEDYGEETNVENIIKLDNNAPMYNILGMPVDESYEGIIIQDGKKYLVR